MDGHRNGNRSRKNELLLYLSDDEKYILDEKTRLSGMRSRAAFLRHLIVYGHVKANAIIFWFFHLGIGFDIGY